MIIGAVSISIAGDASSALNIVRKYCSSEDLVFHGMTGGCFTGGYYVHPRLPYTPADLYYSDEANDILVLLSGTVFNKEELLPLCNITASIPDPELIARLFLLEGPEFVKRLNGDFAICISQPSIKHAYLFRDHVGIHPLAWTADRKTLFFSTDITGLCRAFSDGREADSDYLTGYFRYIDYRKTPDERIKKLLPGHFLFFSENGTKITKFWEPEKIKTDRTLTYDRMLSDLTVILRDAVRIRCDHRFTAGAHVSSGLDSGIVSTLARKEYQNQEDFYGFSWSPVDYATEKVKFDERGIAIKSAENASIRLIFSRMNEVDFLQFVSSLNENHGLFSEEKTVEQASKVRTNLIFSGWGGDEFISTGDRGIETDLLRGLKWRTFFRRNPISQPGKFIRNQLSLVINPALGILDQGVTKSFRNDARYLKKPFKKSDRWALRNFYFHTSRRQMHLRMLEFYWIQDRCEGWYIQGYRKGLEYRYPLLDIRIIEYMLKVPSELLCKTNYYRPVLREIGKGILPEEVRLHWYKNDPVYWAYMDKLFKVSSVLFMEEVDEWKTNRDLHFIDFDLLTEDIARYKENSETIDEKVLYRALVYTKGIHEFTKRYHKS